MYWSSCDEVDLRVAADRVEELMEHKRPVWVIFDKTASGGAAPNALQLKEMLQKNVGQWNG